jgi:hypothetical protein
VADGLDASSIGIVGRVEPARASNGGNEMLAIAIDVRDVHLELKDHDFTGAIDLVVADGHTAVSVQVPLRISEADYKTMLETMFGLGWQLPVAPADEAKELRIVVQDRATGAAGSIRVPLPQEK